MAEHLFRLHRNFTLNLSDWVLLGLILHRSLQADNFYFRRSIIKS